MSLNFSGNYHSFNTEYTDTTRTIAFLPQGITDNESIYYSTFRYEVYNTIGFYENGLGQGQLNVQSFCNKLQ